MRYLLILCLAACPSRQSDPDREIRITGYERHHVHLDIEQAPDPSPVIITLPIFIPMPYHHPMTAERP